MSSDTFILKAVKTPAENIRESPQNPDFIFTDKSLHHYEESLLKGIELIQKSMSEASKPFSGILPHELADGIFTSGGSACLHYQSRHQPGALPDRAKHRLSAVLGAGRKNQRR